MNYDESTVERFCSANNFCGMPMWLKYQNYLFSTVEEKFDIKYAFWMKIASCIDKNPTLICFLPELILSLLGKAKAL